uniref:Calponin-homology (CH) domain-containing protein n=1 Tax=Steinernema glaseri TaxID=37863 RepID=A0A1I8A813_9BILA
MQSDSVCVRSDKKIFADIGLQAEILQLFLSFHPVWLEIGLEIVTGKKITAGANFIAKTAGLIRTHIISDPAILASKKYALGKTKGIITAEGTKMLHRHFLAKMCHFLVAVELMRSSSLVPQVKCLFVKNSPYKCFNDVFVVLSREVIAGSTNLPKYLRKIGFAPDFKQGFFEEYDYSVSGDFVRTLSDGLTLGKVVEIVTGCEIDHVIKKLRNPGGDRIRKLGNIKAVLQVAVERGIDVNDVKPELIVGGDVNTILEVLWRIISFYSVSKHPLQVVLKAAVVIQAAVRGFLARRSYARTRAAFRMKKLTELLSSEPVPTPSSTERDRAAVIIQAAVRGFLARRNYVRTVAASRMNKIPDQAAVKGFLARRNYARTRAAFRIKKLPELTNNDEADPSEPREQLNHTHKKFRRTCCLNNPRYQPSSERVAQHSLRKRTAFFVNK